MKSLGTACFGFAGYVFFFLVCTVSRLNAQCPNADFSSGTFGTWLGTYGTNAMVGGCACPCPYQYTGFNQGPLNDPPTDATTQYNQVICSVAGGNDANLASYGAVLPMVWPGGAYSGRIGNMWQAVGSNGNGDGETISYPFSVTATDYYFTYHYAVVLNDGGHPPGQQPYFNIKVTDSLGGDINCGDFQVDATQAHTIGGFDSITSAEIWWKPWSSVLIPLNAYIGQTVTVTFTTRGCYPTQGGGQCAGIHYA
jgi:hypothetical protein